MFEYEKSVALPHEKRAISLAEELYDTVNSSLGKEPIYVSVDAGYGKSTAVPFIVSLWPDVQYIIATNNNERCNKYFNCFNPRPDGEPDVNSPAYRFFHEGKYWNIPYDEEHDAVVQNRANRRITDAFINKRKPHVIVITTQYLSGLSEEEAKTLVKNRIVLVDEAWINVDFTQLNIAAAKGTDNDDEDSIPYLILNSIDNEVSDLIHTANKNIKAAIENSGDDKIVVPDEYREMYARAASLIPKNAGIDDFREHCIAIGNHKVIAAKSFEKNKYSIYVPVPLDTIIKEARLFINLDATSEFNTSSETVRHQRIPANKMSIEATLNKVEMSTGTQTLLETYNDWSDMIDWLERKDDNGKCVILPKKVITANDDVNREFDYGGKIGYWGKHSIATNEFRNCNKMVIFGASYIPPQVDGAFAAYLIETAGGSYESYSDIENSEKYKEVSSNRMAAALIQCAYRCAIREHTDKPCDIWFCFKDYKNSNLDLAYEKVCSYMIDRGATRVDNAELPFKLEKTSHKGEYITYNSLAAYTNKKSKTGEVARYCIANNCEVSIDVCKRIVGKHWKVTYDVLKDLK